MDINKIPGFEKTPEKIEIGKQCLKVYRIAGIFCDMTRPYIFEEAKQIKKLLDDRRELLKLAFDMWEIINIMSSSIEKTLFKTPYGKGCIQIFEKITGKTWEELQE